MLLQLTSSPSNPLYYPQPCTPPPSWYIHLGSQQEHQVSFPEASFSMWCHPPELLLVALFSNRVA